MILLDNFYEGFDELQSFMMSPYFSWHFNDGINTIPDERYQFIHLFYKEFELQHFDWVAPLCMKIGYKSLVKDGVGVKANLNVRTQEPELYGYHNDCPDKTTAIFYVNTNNGYTKFETGDIVESVANRVVIFDSNIKHTGVSCTDEKRRVVINFNGELQ